MIVSEALVRRAKQNGAALLRTIRPDCVIRDIRIGRARRRSIKLLDAWSRDVKGPSRARRVMVDGQWENPNHWLRYAMLRKALNLGRATEVGILGRWGRREVHEIFVELGISEVIDYFARAKVRPTHYENAKRLVANWDKPEDVLATTFPGGFPASFVYDGLLKNLQVGVLDPRHPELVGLVAQALGYLEAATEIVDRNDFDLVCLSHHSSWTYGALVWAALNRGIPVVHLYGEFGVLRLGLLTEPQHIFSAQERPSPEEFDAIPPSRRRSMETVGADFVCRRVRGHTTDLGAKLAYVDRTDEVDRIRISQQFGWNPEKPMIGIFAHSWFDFPHSIGMSWFRDFVDWIHCTLGAVGRFDGANFVFKAHPADNWYPPVRGKTLTAIIAETDLPHIALADEGWNGGGFLRALDGVVTCHGTIAIEAAASGIPALVAHAGWYGHLGFTVTPSSREEYIEKLGSPWWQHWDKGKAIERASVLAGMVYGAPGWQESYAFYDDTRQADIYFVLKDFLNDFDARIDHEVENIAKWWSARHRYYHVFSMLYADEVQNIRLFE